MTLQPANVGVECNDGPHCMFMLLVAGGLLHSFRLGRLTSWGNKSFMCSSCGYRSFKWGHIVQHQRTHTGERPFFCHLCPARFAQKNNLTRHVRSHTGERPFKCRICGLAFARPYIRHRHEQSHFDGQDGHEKGSGKK